MKMYITEEQAQQLRSIKERGGSGRKSAKQAVMRTIKQQHGIARSQFITLFIENPENPLYRVIRSKGTGAPLDNGIADPAPTPVIGVSPASDSGHLASEAPDTPLKVPSRKASAAPASKRLAAPAPDKAIKKPAAKAVKPAAKTTAKKAAVAAVSKAAGKPVKAVAPKAAAKAPAKKVAAKTSAKSSTKAKATSKA